MIDQITLYHPTLDQTLILPPDILWDKRLATTKHVANYKYSVGGSLINQHAVIKTGNSIELKGGTDFGIISGLELTTLLIFANDYAEMTLNYSDQVTKTVIFDYTSEFLSFNKIQQKYTDELTDYYNNVKIKFTDLTI
jgi:hypothetical protein